MVKCENTKCPLKERCKRHVDKPSPIQQEYKKFEYTAVKNKEGEIVGYTCQFQKFV